MRAWSRSVSRWVVSVIVCSAAANVLRSSWAMVSHRQAPVGSRATARSTTFSSSRTFPGHGYARIFASAGADKVIDCEDLVVPLDGKPLAGAAKT